MSIVATVDQISEELEQKIINDVMVEKIQKVINPMFKPKPIIIRPYSFTDDTITLPFRWALDNVPGIHRKTRIECDSMGDDVKFIGKLRENQIEVKDSCLKALNRYGCHLLSLFVGYGKTFFSIYLACKIGLKTLVITNRVGLIEQWCEEIKIFVENVHVSVLQPKPTKKNPLVTEADFLIVNAENIKKFDKGVFDKVGCVIVDEIHSIMAERLSECLYHVHPRYLLGLSATPYRPDGLDGLFDFYFGKDNKTVKELYHKHVVYKITTDIEFEQDSKTDWNGLITAQCVNEKRNQFIVDLASYLKDKCILILTKRVDQAKIIYERLAEIGEIVSLLTGDNNEYDKNSRLIVASVQKAGMGFSYSRLDTLILASDVISDDTEEFFVQYIGRIFRRQDVKPVIFDILDEHKVLKRHFGVRKRVYEKTGGVIEKCPSLWSNYCLNGIDAFNKILFPAIF